MRIDVRCLRFVPIAGLCLAAVPAMAFEPGTTHVCVPSSDGQSFDCRDTSAAAAEPAQHEPVTGVAPETAQANPVQAAPAPAAPTRMPMVEPAPAASRPPSYLLQQSGDTGLPLEAPAPEPATVSEPTPGYEPAPASAAAATPAAETAVEANRAQAAPAVEVAPAPAAVEAAPLPAAEPAASTPTEPKAVDSDAARTETPAAESRTVNSATGTPPPAPAASKPLDGVLGAEDFARLPGAHYTLVLASVREPGTLDALIAAMADRPGALYLLKFGMPDGTWYSLCWAEFDDVEAARAARVQLPDESTLSSGWPRRIGLLQAEITREAPNR